MPEEIQKQFKQYIAKVDTDDEDRTLTAVISTDAVDRDDEVLKPLGVDFDSYLKNPIVLWAHDYHSPPIGKTLWITKSRTKITAKMKFADTPRAEEIYQLYKGKYLNAFSVGFLSKESHRPEPKEIEKRPELSRARNIIDKWELLEYSPVPVPANPEALATAVKTKEITVSKELQTELGLEDEETFYPAVETNEIVEYGHEDGWALKALVIPRLKPEETENYIRLPVRDCKITATISISAKEGIKALYCGKVKKVATYLFSKEKGWTMAKAKAWVKEHDSDKGIDGVCAVKPKKHPKLKKSLKGKLHRHIDPNECAEYLVKILKGRMN